MQQKPEQELLRRVNKFLLASILCLASSAVPAFAAPKPALPSSVRAFLPGGATSFLCERLMIGPDATKMLVHVWGAMRFKFPDSNNPYNHFFASPICVDIFAPRLDEKKRWGWHLVSSASYIDATSPVAIIPHWLDPSKKQGAVLEIISGNGAPGVSTYHTLLVWPKSFEETYHAPVPQTFGSGGSGGGSIRQTFGVDQKGQLIITEVNAFGGRAPLMTRYRWNGERFVPSSTADY